MYKKRMAGFKPLEVIRGDIQISLPTYHELSANEIAVFGTVSLVKGMFKRGRKFNLPTDFAVTCRVYNAYISRLAVAMLHMIKTMT